jgi:hypothetical protein
MGNAKRIRDDKGFVDRGQAQSPLSHPVDIPITSYDGPWQLIPKNASLPVTCNVGLQATTVDIDEDTHIRSGATTGDNNYGAAATLLLTKDATTYSALIRASTMFSGNLWEELIAVTLDLWTIGNATMTEAEIAAYWISNANGSWIPGVGNNVDATTGEPSHLFRAAPSTPWAGSAGLLTPTTDFDPEPFGTVKVRRSASDRKWAMPLDVERMKAMLFNSTPNNGFLLRVLNAYAATWNIYVSSNNSATATRRPKLRFYQAKPFADSQSTNFINYITNQTYAMEFRVRGTAARYGHGAQLGVSGAPLNDGDIIDISEDGDYRLNVWADVDTDVFFRPKRRDSWTGMR